MVEVSIICLVYKSKKLAKAVYDSLYENTPMLRNGKAELIFVANDPTVELVNFLKDQKYPFIINVNERLSEEEMFKLGYGKPEYIRRVYRGYNRGILEAKGDKICLINSDNFFSEDWLENLLKYLDYKKIVCSTLVEPGHEKFGVFPFAIQANFGKTIEDFQKENFYEFAATISKTGFSSGGAYMPCLMYKDIAIFAGLYPEGNLAGKNFDDIIRYGDEYFYDRLNAFGVKHITSKDSIVYHLKEGEVSDSENGKVISQKRYKYIGLNKKYNIEPSESINYLSPEPLHFEIMEKIGRKFSAIIIDFEDSDELNTQIKQVKNLLGEQAEIVVFYNPNFDLKSTCKKVRYVKLPNKNQYRTLSEFIYKMYGEYLFVCKKGSSYKKNLFDFVKNDKELYYLGCPNEVVDYKKVEIDRFIISKSFLTQKVNFYADLIISGITADFTKFENKIVYLENIHYPFTYPMDQNIPKYKKTLTYKVLRKVYRKGLLNMIQTVSHRFRGK